jgi:hypothetical protein
VASYGPATMWGARCTERSKGDDDRRDLCGDMCGNDRGRDSSQHNPSGVVAIHTCTSNQPLARLSTLYAHSRQARMIECES